MNPLNQTLQQTLDDITEELQPKSKMSKSKKNIIKYSIGIFLSLIMISIVLFYILFKFNIFESKNIYNLDIQIKREENQAYYYKEKKIIKSKVIHTSDNLEEIEQIIDTTFMVVLTDSIKDNEANTINHANLIILDSKAKINQNETKLNSFNIFNESILNEFESSPNGSKYPISKFIFFKNGTIKEIYLPKDMDQYNAQLMVELIDNIVIKLTRNKKEDEDNGFTIKVNNNIVSEIQEQREYSDKYTEINYKGSQFSKSVERGIEDEIIKKIKTNTNLYLETQKKGKDIINFGLDNYNLSIDSDISLVKYSEKEEKISQLVKKLTQRLEFIKSDDLIKNIISKEQKEIEKEQKLYKPEENKEWSETKYLRQLESEGEFSFDWTLLKTDILGQTINIKYSIQFSYGLIQNVLIIDIGSKKISLGNYGVDDRKLEIRQSLGEITLFKIPFPGCPIPIFFNFIIGGEIGFSIEFGNSTEVLSVGFSGDIYAKAEVSVGIKYVISVSVGAKGVLIGLSATHDIIKKSYLYSYDGVINVYGGEISLYAEGKLFIWKVFYISITLFDGWEKTIY